MVINENHWKAYLMKLINLFFLFLLLIFPVRLFADTFQVKANQMEIVLPSKSCAVRNFAALELQKHLQLISGAAIPIRTMFSGKGYPLYIEKPQTDSLPLKKEEARWKVTPYGAWLYGDDFIETVEEPGCLRSVPENPPAQAHCLQYIPFWNKN